MPIWPEGGTGVPADPVPGYWPVFRPVAETVRVMTGIRERLRDPERVRRLAYGAVGLIIVAVVTTVEEGVSVPAGWAWLVLPVGLGATALRPRYRTLVFAVCAGFVAIVSTGESVQLGLAAAGLVFVSVCEDPARHPWLGWVGGLIGAAGALTIALVNERGLYEQPFFFVTAGYLLAILLRSWSRDSPHPGDGPTCAARPPGSNSAPTWPASCMTWSAITSPRWWCRPRRASSATTRGRRCGRSRAVAARR